MYIYKLYVYFSPKANISFIVGDLNPSHISLGNITLSLHNNIDLLYWQYTSLSGPVEE